SCADVRCHTSPRAVSVVLLFHATARTVIYTLSLHDALPIFFIWASYVGMFWVIKHTVAETQTLEFSQLLVAFVAGAFAISTTNRSEEHTSELQSRENLVCRLLLEKQNQLNSADHANVSLEHR